MKEQGELNWERGDLSTNKGLDARGRLRQRVKWCAVLTAVSRGKTTTAERAQVSGGVRPNPSFDLLLSAANFQKPS